MRDQFLNYLRNHPDLDPGTNVWEIHETPLSIVTIENNFAYKWKKPVLLPYLDQRAEWIQDYELHAVVMKKITATENWEFRIKAKQDILSIERTQRESVSDLVSIEIWDKIKEAWEEPYE